MPGCEITLTIRVTWYQSTANSMNVLPPARKRRAKADGCRKIVDNPKTKTCPATSIKMKRTESKSQGSQSQGPATPSFVTKKTSNTASESKTVTDKTRKKKKKKGKSPGTEKKTGKAKAKGSLKQTATTVPLGLSKSTSVNAKTTPRLRGQHLTRPKCLKPQKIKPLSGRPPRRRNLLNHQVVVQKRSRITWPTIKLQRVKGLNLPNKIARP